MKKEELMFDQSLRKLNMLFVLSGMNLKHKIITTSDTIKHRWLFVFNFLTLVLVFSLASCYVFFGVVNKKNIIELTSLLPCMTMTVLGIFKSFNHLAEEGKITDVIEMIRKLERDENQREESVEKRNIEKQDQMFLNRVINAFYVAFWLLMVAFNTMPLVLMAVKYHKTQKFEMMLQYVDIFEYAPYEMKYWIPAYIHQIWAEYVVLLELGAADCLLYTCSFYIRTHFKLLQHDIENLIPVSVDVMPHIEFQNKFSKLAIRHQEIIRSTEILEAIYTSSNLVNFLSSSLLICFTGFTLSAVHDFEVVVKYMTFLVVCLMQIFFLCWFADMMTSASTDISNAVYNSRWYGCRVSGSKSLLLMQTRAQRPCALSAAGFADVNLSAFLSVLSTSWSYFALLQTMYGASDN